MIQIKPVKDAESHNKYLLILDGIPIESGYAFAPGVPDDNTPKVFATLYEVEDSQRLAEHTFTELPFKL